MCSSAISFCVTNGEVSPFIGHNAFLRWSAVQDAAFVDPDDGITKQWNESCVSEDFDMSLRIQMKGWAMRWATYSNGGFQEGVSLTAVDELNRWQKCKSCRLKDRIDYSSIQLDISIRRLRMQ